MGGGGATMHVRYFCILFFVDFGRTDVRTGSVTSSNWVILYSVGESCVLGLSRKHCSSSVQSIDPQGGDG